MNSFSYTCLLSVCIRLQTQSSALKLPKVPSITSIDSIASIKYNLTRQTALFYWNLAHGQKSTQKLYCECICATAPFCFGSRSPHLSYPTSTKPCTSNNANNNCGQKKKACGMRFISASILSLYIFRLYRFFKHISTKFLLQDYMKYEVVALLPLLL